MATWSLSLYQQSHYFIIIPIVPSLCKKEFENDPVSHRASLNFENVSIESVFEVYSLYYLNIQGTLRIYTKCQMRC